MNTNRQVLLAAALASAAVYGNAFAATSTANLAVTATVASECAIVAAPTLGFGAYSPVGANSAAALDGSGNLSVTCTTGSTAPTIALNDGTYPGAGSSGVIPVRQMADGGANRLGYFLYQEAGRTTIWGDGVTAKAVTTPDGTAHTETIYGKVTAGQNVPVGSYSDTVVVTVTF